MSPLSLSFGYLAKRYFKNLLIILLGLSFAFAMIDYFQYAQRLSVAGNYKVLYAFYMWEQALGLLYPLSIVFALIMTKIALIKEHTMGIFYAFGYSTKALLAPFLSVAFVVYALFSYLHTTEFSYAREKGAQLLKHQIGAYHVEHLFFKYNQTFVYINKLNPIEKKIEDITLFEVRDDRVASTLHAPYARFNGNGWTAYDAIEKEHYYQKGELVGFKVFHQAEVKTLKGYKPKIIESLYEGKRLSVLDAYYAWRLLEKQGLNSSKMRAVLYYRVVVPLFALALMVILFFKIPFHERMMHLGVVMAWSLGVTFVVWGVLFGLHQMGLNGVVIPELTSLLPVILLWLYALYLLFVKKEHL